MGRAASAPAAGGSVLGRTVFSSEAGPWASCLLLSDQETMSGGGGEPGFPERSWGVPFETRRVPLVALLRHQLPVLTLAFGSHRGHGALNPAAMASFRQTWRSEK